MLCLFRMYWNACVYNIHKSNYNLRIYSEGVELTNKQKRNNKPRIVWPI